MNAKINMHFNKLPKPRDIERQLPTSDIEWFGLGQLYAKLTLTENGHVTLESNILEMKLRGERDAQQMSLNFKKVKLDPYEELRKAKESLEADAQRMKEEAAAKAGSTEPEEEYPDTPGGNH